ncbi:hypothetical protein FRC14_004366 [Serendipita sp. 396]|nr:hypothetical protein FRC14_004366 [Serendipita sp. 396]KAG8779313.1 hypothetical protein FRC15_010261 [Serendipita sp. 397]KAG8865649.1 hypothetical protein FRC20_009621 [Serendipita sp. 405]
MDASEADPVEPSPLPGDDDGKGPQTFYDVESINESNPRTVHIQSAIAQWYWVSTGRRRAQAQEQKSIITELIAQDEVQEQPSWAQQWFKFVYSTYENDTEMIGMPHINEQFRLLLNYFVLLRQDPTDREEHGLRLLKAERKKCGFGYSLEYGSFHKEKATCLELKGKREIRHPFGPPILPRFQMHKRNDSMQSNSSGTSHATSILSTSPPPTNSNLPVCSPPPAPTPTIHSWTPPKPIAIATGGDTVEYEKDLTTSTNPVDLTSNYATLLATQGKIPPDISIYHLWAHTRPDLCESVPYFRSFQGGFHKDQKSGLMGYLLDGHPAPGDIWARDGRLIVSHGGGSSRVETAKPSPSSPSKCRKESSPSVREVASSSVKHPRNSADELLPTICESATAPSPSKKGTKLDAQRFLERDQSTNRAVKSLLQARDDLVPVALIVGRDYRWWPLQMDFACSIAPDTIQDSDDKARYAILGWYMVRDAWPELEPGKPTGQDGERTPLFIRWKFAFEWIEAQGTPWWIQTLDKAVATSETCDPHPDPESRDIETDEQVLQEPPPSITNQTCSRCETSSQRIYYQGWFCLNPDCSQFCMLLNGSLSTEITLAYSQDFISKPHINGIEIKATKAINISDYLAPRGEEDMWPLVPSYSKDLDSFTKEHWQGRCCNICGRLNAKISWESWECRSCNNIIEEPSKTIYLASQFIDMLPDLSQDYRADSFIAAEQLLDLTNFNGLRLAIPEAGDIYWLRPYNLKLANELFEEYQQQASNRPMFKRSLLKCAFVPGQHTCHFLHNAGLHYNFCCQITTDNFETGPPVVKRSREVLSSYVTSLLKRQVDFNEVLSCAYKKEQSMNFHSDDELGVEGTIAAISLGSTAKMSFRRKSGHELGENVCLELNLRHGDILVMDGIGIQHQYQHRVVPTGLRFAATARRIDPEALTQLDDRRRWKPQKKRKIEKSNGTICAASSEMVQDHINSQIPEDTEMEDAPMIFTAIDEGVFNPREDDVSLDPAPLANDFYSLHQSNTAEPIADSRLESPLEHIYHPFHLYEGYTNLAAWVEQPQMEFTPEPHSRKRKRDSEH